MEVAHYRKGLAAFALEDFATAKQALEQGQELVVGGTEPAGRKYATWIRKCQVELEDTQKENEMPASSSSSTSAATATAESASSSAVPPSTPAVAPPSTPAAAAKYQYYQTPTHLTVTLLQKGVKEEDATVTIEPRRLKITQAGAGGSGVVVLFDKSPLFDAVVPEESTTKFFATKVEIKLKKATVGCQWDDLVGGGSSSGNRISPVTPPTAASPAVPLTTAKEGQAGKAPRPYASHKDWDKVEREIEKELESDKPQGEEALNKLFQDIYAKGDEETRRAMVKSFQTSGGTVLSTNWGEVAKKDYEADEERKPPQGMQWRKWN